MARRSPPDLCIIAVLKMLPLADQLRAGRMNRRWTVLLRAANRRVRSLKILCSTEEILANDNYIIHFQSEINLVTLGGTSRSMHMLKDAEGKTLYPITGPLTKWNCLMMRFSPRNMPENGVSKNTFTVAQIANAFSAITELTFVTHLSAEFEHLVELLEQHPDLSRQLTSFTLIDGFLEDERGVGAPSLVVNRRLLAAINTGMPSLQRLAIKWDKGLKIVNNLSVIAQLKVLWAWCENDNFDNIIYSLDQYAEDAVDLQVYLHCHENWEARYLSERIRDRVIYICWNRYNTSWEDNLPKVHNEFRSVVSVREIYDTEHLVGENFNALEYLNKFTQLVHLDLTVKLNNNELAGSMAVLRSVRALDLSLTITDHQQVDWLNLGRTMPNLEAFCLTNFRCRCKFDLYQIRRDDAANRSAARQCLRTILPKLHLGRLPMSRIEVRFGFDVYRTAEEVCTVAQEE